MVTVLAKQLPVPISFERAPSAAQVKLAVLVRAAGNVTQLARNLGCQPNTIRLLLAGGQPRSVSMERLQQHGIQPSDWFTSPK